MWTCQGFRGDMAAVSNGVGRKAVMLDVEENALLYRAGHLKPI